MMLSQHFTARKRVGTGKWKETINFFARLTYSPDFPIITAPNRQLP